MKLKEFFQALENMPNRNFKLDDHQQNVVSHGDGPLWVVAGPGSGKTDSIVFRCIKLLVVDNVAPSSIILTTFTEKASINLQNRIIQYMQYLSSKDPSLAEIDYNLIRIGTLHSLCNDIMQEFRFAGYQNFRLLDDIEQRLFILEHSSAASLDQKITSKYDHIWKTFPEAFSGYDPLAKSSWKPASDRAPNRNMKAKGLSVLFNRVVEDMLNIDLMRSEGDGMEELVNAYKEYRDKLFDSFRCDFAHVQAKFLEFLQSQQAKLFLEGDNTNQYPGVRHVLVDEYQDTNPIQEAIYFSLAEKSKNLCVVGDDDQALYRFRGGTVDCMVNFESSCKTKWGVPPGVEFLSTNYRSNPGIVSFYDGYIRSFSEMSIPGARVRGKPNLKPGSSINGSYPAVAIHKGKNAEEVAEFFAKMIEYLKKNSIINDYSECVLLSHSTRKTKNNAGPFMDALEKHHIPCYNPRSRGLLEEEEVKVVLGGMLEILDPDSKAQNSVKFPVIRDKCSEWRKDFHKMAEVNPDISDYVKRYSNSILKMGPGASVGVNLLEIFYDLLNFQPLSKWIDDPERSVRLGVVCTVLDAFSNVPSAQNKDRMMGYLYTSSQPNKGISFTWRKNFYYSLLGILTSEGLNEAKDEIEDFPKGRVSIMTIHQSKGLEFPIVFVYGLSPKEGNGQGNPAVKLENSLSRFRKNTVSLPANLTPDQKNKQDIIRLFFVAYSRAQYALILLAKSAEYTKPGIGFGSYPSWSLFSIATEIMEE